MCDGACICGAREGNCIRMSSYASLSVGTNYFGSHFFLGNCKFNSPSPEVFLFGENNDLNYLGTHPVTVTMTTVHLSHGCINVHVV